MSKAVEIYYRIGAFGEIEECFYFEKKIDSLGRVYYNAVQDFTDPDIPENKNAIKKRRVPEELVQYRIKQGMYKKIKDL